MLRCPVWKRRIRSFECNSDWNNGKSFSLKKGAEICLVSSELQDLLNQWGSLLYCTTVTLYLWVGPVTSANRKKPKGSFRSPECRESMWFSTILYISNSVNSAWHMTDAHNRVKPTMLSRGQPELAVSQMTTPEAWATAAEATRARCPEWMLRRPLLQLVTPYVQSLKSWGVAPSGEAMFVHTALQ